MKIHKIHRQPAYLAVLAFAALPSIHAENFPGPDLFQSSVQINGPLTLSSPDGALFTGNYGYGATAPSGSGVRMLWNPKKGAFRAGFVSGNSWDDANIGNFSFAAGSSTLASGSYSTAFGYGTFATGGYGALASGWATLASGFASTATGQVTTASGATASSMGYLTQALGYTSVAANYATIAGGDYSTSLGFGTTANAFASIAVGRHNVIQGNPSSWVETDPLFVIGNGNGVENDANRYRNALTVYKDGKITMMRQGDILMGEFGTP